MIPGMNENYDISSELEFDQLLVDVPFTMLKDLVKTQISDPSEVNVNYIDLAIDKFRALEEMYEEDTKVKYEVRALNIDFFSSIISEISTKFDISVDVDYNSQSQVEETACVLYHFFIRGYIKRMRRFMYRYINDSKKSLALEFEPLEKKKDVTTLRLKKMTSLKGKDEIIIISQLNTVIRAILQNYEFTNEEFLEYAIRSSSYEAIKMTDYIQTGRIVGNFVQSYFELMLDDDSCIDRIQNFVQNKMI